MDASRVPGNESKEKQQGKKCQIRPCFSYYCRRGCKQLCNPLIIFATTTFKLVLCIWQTGEGVDTVNLSLTVCFPCKLMIKTSNMGYYNEKIEGKM